MFNNHKIGVGIVTYNAPERIKESALTVPSNVDKFVIINDGTPYPDHCYPKTATIINHDKNLGVGCAKNNALRYLIQEGCEYLFIMEDDILIKDLNVFDAYLKAAHKSGLWHLMYGYHGPANVTEAKQPHPRQVVDYGDNVQIAFNVHCVGAFCLYLKGIIRNIGYMDERYKNCWEHVSHSYAIAKAGLIPAYWWWPDIANSMDYLQEIGSSEVQTVITHTDEWKKAFQTGAHLFKHLYGYFPTEVPDTPQEQVLEKIKFIQKNYAKKD